MFLQDYGTTMGPIGVPMTDEQARQLDAVLKTLDTVEHQRMPIAKAVMDLVPDERADVGWITTESVDRHRDIVLAAGMDDSHFQANPIVTLGHNYEAPPVGRSAWRIRVQENHKRGIKAKTVYPKRPNDWPEKFWAPDVAFALVKAKLAIGKSIGFLPLETSSPTSDEIRTNPDWANARRVVRKWLLLEYAIHWMPVNQESLVEAVTKGGIDISPQCLEELGMMQDSGDRDKGAGNRKLDNDSQFYAPKSLNEVIPFTTLDSVKKSIETELRNIDVSSICGNAVQQAIQQHQGKI
ncbi:MAG: hypothetical protein ACFCD0_23850 [Gemmataceae bacterium]